VKLRQLSNDRKDHKGALKSASHALYRLA